MKTILYLAALATLLATSGCVIRDRDHDRGGYRGPGEYERGHYRGYPDRDYYHRDWDDNHRYRY